MRCAIVLLALAAFGAALPQQQQKQRAANQDLVKKQQDVIVLLQQVNQEIPDQQLQNLGSTYDIQNNLQQYNNPNLVNYYASAVQAGLVQPKGTSYSSSISQLRKEVALLQRTLLSATDYQTFLATAAWARVHVNEEQFVRAFITVVLQHPETQDVILPPLYEIIPQYYFDARIIQEIQNIVAQSVGQNPVFVPVNYTANLADDEQQLSYFTQDIGLANYYAFVNLVGDLSQNAQQQSPAQYQSNQNQQGQNGQGTIYYYIHQQLQAHYELNRLANGFGPVQNTNFDNVQAPYQPHLRHANGLQFPSRPSNLQLGSVKNNLINTVKKIEQRLIEAIDSGHVITPQGAFLSLYQPQGLNILGELIQGTGKSVNPRYYGSLQAAARQLLGNAPEVQNIYDYTPSVLESGSIAVRDPAFYQLFNKVIQLFQQYQNSLPAYQYNDVLVSGVSIQNVQISPLVTFFDNYYVDVSNAAAQQQVGRQQQNQQQQQFQQQQYAQQQQRFQQQQYAQQQQRFQQQQQQHSQQQQQNQQQQNQQQQENQQQQQNQQQQPQNQQQQPQNQQQQPQNQQQQSQNQQQQPQNQQHQQQPQNQQHQQQPQNQQQQQPQNQQQQQPQNQQHQQQPQNQQQQQYSQVQQQQYPQQQQQQYPQQQQQQYPQQQQQQQQYQPQVQQQQQQQAQQQQQIQAQVQRLDHKPYEYQITVQSEQNVPSVVVRVYLGPKFDHQGNPISISQHRQQFVELDQFITDLQQGQNVIVRQSQQAPGQSFDYPSVQEIQQSVNDAVHAQKPFYITEPQQIFGFPARLTLPKGQQGQGFPVQLFVVISQPGQQSPSYGPVTPEQFQTYQQNEYQVIGTEEYQQNQHQGSNQGSGPQQAVEVVPENLSVSQQVNQVIRNHHANFYAQQFGQNTHAQSQVGQRQGQNAYGIQSQWYGHQRQQGQNRQQQSNQSQGQQPWSQSQGQQPSSQSQGQQPWSQSQGQNAVGVQGRVPTGVQGTQQSNQDVQQGVQGAQGNIVGGIQSGIQSQYQSTYQGQSQQQQGYGTGYAGSGQTHAGGFQNVFSQGQKVQDSYVSKYYQNKPISQIIGGAISLDGKPFNYPLDRPLSAGALSAPNVYVHTTYIQHEDQPTNEVYYQ